MPSAHVDTFARDRLPPTDQQPEFLFELGGEPDGIAIQAIDKERRTRIDPVRYHAHALRGCRRIGLFEEDGRAHRVAAEDLSGGAGRAQGDQHGLG